MPFVAAVAASHAPNILLEPGAEWDEFMQLHYRMAPQASSSKPSLEAQQKLRATREGLRALRADLEDRNHVLIVVATIKFGILSSKRPTFFITLADEGMAVHPAQVSLPQSQRLGRAIRKGHRPRSDFSFGEHICCAHQTVTLILFCTPKIPYFRFTEYLGDRFSDPRRCYRIGELIRPSGGRLKDRVAILPRRAYRIFRVAENRRERHAGRSQASENLARRHGRSLADDTWRRSAGGGLGILNGMVVIGAIWRRQSSKLFICRTTWLPAGASSVGSYRGRYERLSCQSISVRS